MREPVKRHYASWSLAVFCAIASMAAVAPAHADEASETKAGIDALGIKDGWRIVVGDERDVVEQTAAEELQRILARAGLEIPVVPESEAPESPRFLLGRLANLKALQEPSAAGAIRIKDISSEDDGFHLTRVGEDIVVAGANPRGVLYGVYAFEGFVAAGGRETLDIRKVPYFRKRGSGLHYTDVIFSAELDSFPEENARCLARLGINQLTDQGLGGHLSKFVRSEVFPFQAPPDPTFQSRLKKLSAVCRKYGIEVYLFLVEPALVPVAGSVESYPEEALGTVRPPWGGDEQGLARTLCVSSPLAQRYLQEMMKKLVREYPDVKGVNLYNLDSGSWLCTPAFCDRCREACPDTPPEAFNPAETQAAVVKLLADAAHQERPDFDFRFWATVHYHGADFERMIRMARSYNGLLSSWTGSDRTVMVPDAAERVATCVLTQTISKERDVPFYMMCEFNNLEVIPKSLPFPFHVCDALKKYKRWDVRNLTEIFGIAPEHNSINALVMKEFEWNPDQPVEPFLMDLAQRQFGAEAGQRMYGAWEEMKAAFDVWNDVVSPPFPLQGSQFHTKIGIAIGGLPHSITPDAAETVDWTIDVLSRVEPWMTQGYDEHRTEGFLRKMELMNVHLARAAREAKSAVEAASEETRIGVYSYRGADGLPTSKAYAELHYAPIAIADALCRQRCHLLHARALLAGARDARAAGDESTARDYEARYRELVREDIQERRRFVELLDDFSKMQPCYTRTSLTDQEIANGIAFTRERIREAEEYLAAALAGDPAAP